MWQKFIGVFDEFGLAAGFLYLVDRALRWFSPRLGLRVYELMAQTVSAEPLLPTARVRNLTFGEISRGDPCIDQMPARGDIRARRFEQGAKCLGVYRKGDLIGYVWFCFHRYEEDEVRCTYELNGSEASAFDFDLHVFPEHRMGTGFACVWHAANEYLRERGVSTTFSRMTRFNLTSRNAHLRLGSQRIGRVTFLQLWALEAMLANVRPFVALTWSRRVTLSLPYGDRSRARP